MSVSGEPGYGWVSLTIGRTPLEVAPEGGSYTDRPQLDELRAICEAVVNGEFEEVMWTANGTIVKVDGRIRIGGVMTVIHYATLRSLNPLSARARTEIVYQPYVARP